MPDKICPTAKEGRRYTVVHVTTVPQTLGFLRGQAMFMRLRGIDLQAISSPGDKLIDFGQNESIPVNAVDMVRTIAPLRDVHAVFELCAMFRRIRPTIVHGHTPKAGFLSMIAAWFARVPIRIYHLHGLRLITLSGLSYFLLNLAERVSCLLADRILSVSHSVREVAISMKLCSQSKITVPLHGSVNGVDALNRFSPHNVSKKQRLELRRRLGIPLDVRVIGFVGRLVGDKGIGDLVEGFLDLKNQNLSVHLVIAGDFETHDPLPKDLERTLQEEPSIHLTGRVEDLAPLYSIMDIFALPSYREGLATVLLEAAAMERPVVATRIPGIIDVVVDGSTGILVPVRNAQALATAFRTYLENPKLRDRHGKAGRERILRDFKPVEVVEALYQTYARLLNEKGLSGPVWKDKHCTR